MDASELSKKAKAVKAGLDTYSYWRSKAGFILLALMGLAFFVYGGYRVYSKYKFQKDGLQADAEVIDFRKETTHDNDRHKTDTSYLPILRFTTASGDAVTAEYNLASNPPEFAKGEHVTVYYFANDPTRIETGTNDRDMLVFGGMAVIGIVLLIVGIIRFLRGG